MPLPARSHGDLGARRAEVLAALSLSIDLGLGLPMEHVLRSSLLAGMLADELGLDEEALATVYYTNLVLWIGCHADSHEFSRWFGDDLAVRAKSYEIDQSGLPYLRFLLRHAGSGRPAARRTQLVLMLLLTPRTRMAALMHSHCLSAGAMAERIGLDRSVSQALQFAFERWDGGGVPGGHAGTELPLATRVVQLAETCEVHLRSHGVSAAIEVARRRSGTHFDPDLVAALERCRGRLHDLPDQDVWTRALEQAPDHDRVLAGEELDALLMALGDFADLKCPFTVGHSRAVAALAAGAAARIGLPEREVQQVRRAGFVHDLGRMGVPNTVWEKATPLSDSDAERIRLYPYLTARILGRVAGLEAETAIAGAHRERLDGTGYPHGLRGAALSMAQRTLAAADTYQGSLEQRPYRTARTPAAAAEALRAQAAAGRLDRAAVDAVLAEAGHRAEHPFGRPSPGPAGLTAREVEVLCLLVRGAGAAAIARRLSISPKTVRNHIEHIYAKAGVSNRTGVALFALEHGLLGRAEDGASAP